LNKPIIKKEIEEYGKTISLLCRLSFKMKKIAADRNYRILKRATKKPEVLPIIKKKLIDLYKYKIINKDTYHGLIEMEENYLADLRNQSSEVDVKIKSLEKESWELEDRLFEGKTWCDGCEESKIEDIEAKILDLKKVKKSLQYPSSPYFALFDWMNRAGVEWDDGKWEDINTLDRRLTRAKQLNWRQNQDPDPGYGLQRLGLGE
jgi:hypothetical protein